MIGFFFWKNSIIQNKKAKQQCWYIRQVFWWYINKSDKNWLREKYVAFTQNSTLEGHTLELKMSHRKARLVKVLLIILISFLVVVFIHFVIIKLSRRKIFHENYVMRCPFGYSFPKELKFLLHIRVNSLSLQLSRVSLSCLFLSRSLVLSPLLRVAHPISLAKLARDKKRRLGSSYYNMYFKERNVA